MDLSWVASHLFQMSLSLSFPTLGLSPHQSLGARASSEQGDSATGETKQLLTFSTRMHFNQALQPISMQEVMLSDILRSHLNFILTSFGSQPGFACLWPMEKEVSTVQSSSSSDTDLPAGAHDITAKPWFAFELISTLPQTRGCIPADRLQSQIRQTEDCAL